MTESEVVRQKTKLASLHQQIAMAEKEEQKRRARLIDLERQLRELRAQITHAEEHLRVARYKGDITETARKHGTL